MLTAAAGLATRVGLRARNQDRAFAHPPWAFVLDGVGGTPTGGDAAQLALGALLIWSAHNSSPSLDQTSERFIELFNVAHDAVVRGLAGRHPGATTLTAVHLGLRDDGAIDVVIGSVGDSPAWLCSAGSAPVRITEPETRAAGPHALSRALGWPQHSPEVQTLSMTGPSRIVVATDGLEALELRVMHQLMQEDSSAQECADRLATAAIEHGGRDNATVVVIDIERSDPELATDFLDFPDAGRPN